ncbi:MAG: hypothetical protein AAGB31_14535 [Bdellovibrio sp.]
MKLRSYAQGKLWTISLMICLVTLSGCRKDSDTPASRTKPAAKTISKKSDESKKTSTKSETVAKEADGTAKAAEKKESTETLNWNVTDAKFLMKDTLVSVSKGNDEDKILVIVDNSLQTVRTAQRRLADRGRGLYCQTEGADSFNNDDVVKFESAKASAVFEESKTRDIEIAFSGSQAEKNFKLHCVASGDVNYEDLVENMKGILDFRNHQGLFHSEMPASEEETLTQDSQSSGEADDKKTRSFSVRDAEALKRTLVSENGEADLVLTQGKIMKASKAEQFLNEGRIQHLCYLDKIEGDIRRDLAYAFKDTTPNQSRGVSNFERLMIYSATETDSLHIHCIYTRSAPVTAIFDTFKSVLEFGVLK